MANYRRQRDSLEDDFEDDYNYVENKKQMLACWEKVAYHRFTHFFVLLVLCAGVGIGLPLLWNHLWRPDKKIVIESDLRYDCYPLRPKEIITSKECPKDSCLWDELAGENEIPCYYTMEDDLNNNYQITQINSSHGNKQAGVFPRYAVSINEINIDSWGNIEAPLRVMRTPSILSENYNNNVDLTVETKLSVSVQHLSPTHIRVLIKPADEPEDLWTRYLNLNLAKLAQQSNANESLGVVSIQSKNPNIFQLKVSRKGSSNAFFNMGEHSPFIFAHGWREITTSLVNDLVYGLGQTNFENFKHNFSIPQVVFCFCIIIDYHFVICQKALVSLQSTSH